MKMGFSTSFCPGASLGSIAIALAVSLYVVPTAANALPGLTSDQSVVGLARTALVVASADSDGDGLTDEQELALGTNPDAADTDGGGAADQWELLHGADPTDANDDDGLPVDQDIDNDGIPNDLEFIFAPSADSDNDGLSDAREAGFPDADNDGIVDDTTDSNKNGIPDIAETGAPLPDHDADGVPDFLDRDSDQDGVPDRYEHGIDDASVTTSPEGFNFDFDGDGLVNSLDLDSDGDGISDFEEAHVVSYFWLESLQITSFEILEDTDGDGIVDEMADKDQDGIPDSVDASFNTNESDVDNDGIIDKADSSQVDPSSVIYTDYYGDPATRRLGQDSDNDEIIDEYDPDPNGTGMFTGLERLTNFDSDKDGAWTWLDYDDQDPAVIYPPYQATTPPSQAAEPGNCSSANPCGGGGTFGLLVFVLIFVGRSELKIA